MEEEGLLASLVDHFDEEFGYGALNALQPRCRGGLRA